ncbi:autotransporter-associated beta strand repeat-containing protein [Verrucomicrobium sp. BvORR106]|uniref:autotransporter-associated beta strand repeat-containing protein n=1 Tax=Verrucomicrobium sp. BvORR106 TaxID=1403819 RepID=UPI00056F6BF7|nr:autotransporter-associated beta strand repeat-containing protein [Verrucomicrobium sp. BvORR106]
MEASFPCHLFQHLSFRPSRAVGLLVGALLSLPAVGFGATINKANNTTGLNNTGSWTGGVVPTAADIAQWTNAVAAGNATVNTGGNVTFGQIKIVDPGATVNIGGGNTITLAGISGVGIDLTTATQDLILGPALTLSGSQSWELASGRTLTIAGAVANGANTLAINGAGNLITSNNLTISAVSSLSGTVTVRSGTLTLTGAGTLANVSGLTVNSGTFVNGDNTAATNRINPAIGLVLGGTNGSATFTQTAASSGVNTQTFTGLTLKAGVHTLNSTGAGAAVVFAGTAGGAGYVREAGAFLSFGNNTTVSFTNAPTAAGGSTVTSSVLGAANDILTGAVYNGLDFVSAKSGQVGATTSYQNNVFGSGVNSNITTASTLGGDTQSIRFSTGANTILTLSGDTTVQSGGILSAVSGTQVITGGTLRAQGGSNLWIYGNSGNNVRINSVITDNGGAVGLEKYGNNTVGLGGDNTFTGAIYLQGGTVDLYHANAMGSNSATATMTVLGNITLRSNVADVASARNIHINPAQTLTYNTNGFNATLSGVMSANPNVVGDNTSAATISKTGNGILRLTGSLAANSNMGFNLSAGTLDVTGNYASNNPGWNMTGGTGTAAVITVRGNGTLSNTGDWNMITSANNQLVINIQDNGTVGAGRAFISKQAGAAVTINQDGGTFFAGTYVLGANGGSNAIGTATHHLNAGILRFTAGSAHSIDTGSVLYFNGGTLQAAANNGSLAGNNTLGGTAGQIIVKAGGGTIETTATNLLTISAGINHDSTLGATPDGGITKSGTGTLVLSGTNTYTGDTRVNAGTLRLSNSLAVQNSTVATGAGAIVFDSTVVSNAFTFGGLSGATALALANNAGTPQAVALTVGNNNRDASYSGNLTGAGSVTKKGSGTQTFSGGASTYSGGTTVTEGMLLVNNAAGSGTGSGSVSVAAGAKLGGGGSITGGSTAHISLGAGSFLVVGQSHGGVTATVAEDFSMTTTGTGTFSFTSGTLFQFDLFSSIAGADTSLDENDILFISSPSTIQLAGTIQLANPTANSLGWALGDTWKLIDWTGSTVTGDFSLDTSSLPALGDSGYAWSLFKDSTGLYAQVTAVPEPGRAVLLLFAAMAGFMRRRRR